MRGFFLLLLISNLAFIGWQVWSGDKGDEAKPYGGGPIRSEGLRLLSELETEERPAQRKLLLAGEKSTSVEVAKVELVRPEATVAPAPAEKVAGVGNPVCYQSSLLANLEEAKAFQAVIAKLGIHGSQRKTVETTKVNYWVILKPYKSRAKANEAAELLRKKRIRDFFIVPSGRHENAVSLGVFSTRERAEQRYREIRGLKVRLRKPVIEALELPAKRLVVLIRLDQQAKPSGFDALLDSSKQPYLKKIGCNS